MIAVGQLLAETSLSPAQWDLVNTVRCSGETLLTLITDILDFSRIEANKMVLNLSVFKLETVMEAAMEIAGLRAAQKRLQVAYHIAEDTPRVLFGDAQRLQQILLNILNNAVKFTEQGQVLLEVWLESIEPHPVLPLVPSRVLRSSSLSLSNQQPMGSGGAAKSSSASVSNNSGSDSTQYNGPTCQLKFSVRDTGIGISSDDLGRLFNSFTQVTGVLR
jgi:signal transduction histidine kinase